MMIRANRRALTLCIVLALLISAFALPLGAYAEALPQAKAAVKAVKPTSVTLDASGTVPLHIGEKLQLTPTILPEDATNKKVTYVSSKKKVATVSKTGVVTAKKAGTTKITVKTKSGGKKASVKIKVSYKYRFYGISNGNYAGSKFDLPAYKNDLAAMKKVYTAARFNGAKVSRGSKTNLTANGIRSYLQKIGNNSSIDADDVTIIYYSGHGLESNPGSSVNGAMVGVNNNKSDSYVTVGEVTSYLSPLQGDVVVILDSCLSGQYINAKGLYSKAMVQAEMVLYNRSIVNQFAKAQSTQKAMRDSGLTAKSRFYGGATYHVLTACSELESSFSFKFNKPLKDRSLLTLFVQMGTSGVSAVSASKLSADRDGDKAVSLEEMYSYAATDIADLVSSATSGDFSSNIMRYPEDDTFPIFAIN